MRKPKSSQLTKIFQLLLATFPLFLSQSVSAQTITLPDSCQLGLEANLDRGNPEQAKSDVITANTISENGLTIPSLWWTKEQFDPFGGKLVNNWLAYQNERRIDLVVNRQLWTLLDYLGRYRFVNKFGTVAREYQYNLRVFNEQQQCLATYTCNFSTTPHQCDIDFDSSVDNGLKKGNASQ